MHPAATVLLLREQPSGLEVLMMRRASAVAFMGGMWVFPGGRLDPADSSPEALARARADRARQRAGQLKTPRGESLDPATAIGLHVAACREAFEEAGVLLAVASSGAPADPAQVEQLRPRRADITADAGAFARMLEDSDLQLDVDQLVYWSHWITPSLEPKRFDTRFFVAPVPPGQDASADLSELTEHAWINVAEVAQAIERGELKVVPPTLLTLEDLAESYARHGSLEAMLGAERGRATPPVMPKIDVHPGSVSVVMPWDPGYGSVAGEGCGTGTDYPRHFTARRSTVTVNLKRDVRQ